MPLEFSIAAFRFGPFDDSPAVQSQFFAHRSHRRAALDIAWRWCSARLQQKADGPIHNRMAQFRTNYWAPSTANGAQDRSFDLQRSRQSAVYSPGSTSTPAGPLLQHLARRNLLRGFLFSVPTGQAIAGAMDVTPLDPTQLTNGVSSTIQAAIDGGGFGNATPLWYYILQEAQFQHGGDFLGSVGSRIVAETLIGLVRRDRSSYLNQPGHPVIKPNGIEVATGQIISTIGDLLHFSGAPT